MKTEKEMSASANDADTESVPVIEESLEYSDIDDSLLSQNNRKNKFEEYLSKISDESCESAMTNDHASDGQGKTDEGIVKHLPVIKKFRQCIKESLIGRFLSGYEKHEKLLDKSSLSKFIDKRENSASRFAHKFMCRIDNSIIFKGLQNTIIKLTSLSSRCYGLFFLSYSIVGFSLYIISMLIKKNNSPLGFSYLLCSMLSMIMVALLMTSDSSLSFAFVKNKILRLLFVNFLGYRLSEPSEAVPVKPPVKYIFVFLISGAVLGLSTIIIPAYVIWLTVIGIIFLFLSFSSPEFCLNTTILLLPFTIIFKHKTLPVAVLILLCFICYLRKLFLKKRSFEFEPLDFYVIVFTSLYFLSGITSIGGTSSFSESIMHLFLFLGYILAANLFKSERNLACVNCVICLSAGIVSVIGIVEYITGKAQVKWLDTSVFGSENGRIVSVFENPNILAMYLVLALPFIISNIATNRKIISIIAEVADFIAVTVCIILSQSRAGYISLAFIIIIMAAHLTHHYAGRMFAILAFIPHLIALAPSFAGERFLSVFSRVFDSSVSYRFQVWQGSLRVISKYFFTGIGGVSTAFQSVYPEYATAGAESALHSHNIFLQIMIETGIFGLVAFIIMFAVFIQMNSSKQPSSQNKIYPMMQFSAYIAVFAELIFGITDYIWYDKRLLFMFFAVMGICVAAKRINSEQIKNSDESLIQTEFHIDSNI